ncbi:ribosomal protein S18 acetylase RimI-like enzyme [Rhodococcus sp. OK302]|nr:ribosomal protein S18 acetylase RimI-like enzyme [Rhodococcus sp. OK302]
MYLSHQCTCTKGRIYVTITVDRAGIWDSEAIADVAAVTFPLACPPDASDDDISAFIDNVLSVDKFSEYLTDPTRTVLKVISGDAIVGYAMLIDDEPTDPDVQAALTLRPTTELSKLYVLPGNHGSGAAAALMDAAISHAQKCGSAGIWLGVNQENVRAQKFYTKRGSRRSVPRRLSSAPNSITIS